MSTHSTTAKTVPDTVQGNEYLHLLESQHGLQRGKLWQGSRLYDAEQWSLSLKALRVFDKCTEGDEHYSAFHQRWASHMVSVKLDRSGAKTLMLRLKQPDGPKKQYTRYGVDHEHPDCIVSSDVDAEMELVTSVPTIHFYNWEGMLACVVAELMLQVPLDIQMAVNTVYYYSTVHLAGSYDGDGYHRCVTSIYKRKE